MSKKTEDQLTAPSVNPNAVQLDFRDSLPDFNAELERRVVVGAVDQPADGALNTFIFGTTATKSS